jgi:hypothetical protein
MVTTLGPEVWRALELERSYWHAHLDPALTDRVCGAQEDQSLRCSPERRLARGKSKNEDRRSTRCGPPGKPGRKPQAVTVFIDLKQALPARLKLKVSDSAFKEMIQTLMA